MPCLPLRTSMNEYGVLLRGMPLVAGPCSRVTQHWIRLPGYQGPVSGRMHLHTLCIRSRPARQCTDPIPWVAIVRCCFFSAHYLRSLVRSSRCCMYAPCSRVPNVPDCPGAEARPASHDVFWVLGGLTVCSQRDACWPAENAKFNSCHGFPVCLRGYAFALVHRVSSPLDCPVMCARYPVL